MHKSLTRFITESLSHSPLALPYRMSQQVADLFPGQFVLETVDYDFDVDRFVRSGQAIAFPNEGTHSQVYAEWDGETKKVVTRFDTGLLDIIWHGHRIHVMRVRVEDVHDFSYIVADSWNVAEAFFEAVCRFEDNDLDSVLVFSKGRCSRSPGLRRDIAKASFDDLVLPEGFVEQLVDHTASFFDQKEMYESAGLPWRRGVLLLGDPGNGKTHAIKALLNLIQRPCVMVKDLEDHYRSCEPPVNRLFRVARRFPTCVVVMEDIDSMVTEHHRTALLNELDGFASNSGMLVIGTANNPAKLDPALANRPSRFDRKVTFASPGTVERQRFLVKRAPWLDGDSALPEIIESTEGFSYAYMKELCVSSMVAAMGLEGQARAYAWVDCAAALKKEVTRAKKPAQNGKRGDDS